MENIWKQIKSIFDFSFKTFITIKVLRVIYWIQAVLGGVLVGIFIYYGFQESIILGILTIIIAPMVFLIYAVVLRVILEMIVVIFRIAEYAKEISELWKTISSETENGAKKILEVEEINEKE